MEVNKVFIVFRVPAFGTKRVEIVLPNEAMAKDYIRFRDEFGYGGWIYEEHEIKNVKFNWEK